MKYSLYRLCVNTLENPLIEITTGRMLFEAHLTDDTEKINHALITLLDRLSVEFCDVVIMGIVHRVVHGGSMYTKPVKINKQVIEALQSLIPLAPMHIKPELCAINMLFKTFPNTLQVACFDTSFHSTQPELEKWFPLPAPLFNDGIHRYGFHGLSYEYISRLIPKVIPKEHRQKVLVAHLGSGASLCALYKGKSIASSMGFTALDGLMMGTRCGSIDPGVVLHLLQQKGMTADAVSSLLYKNSGLLGVSGESADIRDLVSSESPSAQRALDLFSYSVAKHAGSLIMIMSGIDAIIFTGGVGENSAEIRKNVLQYFHWLNAIIDVSANNTHSQVLHHPKSTIGIYKISTNEEWMLAYHCFSFLKADAF
ncbi:acetate/propionate family kinase [Marinibactrum halimedae]|nr:acetate/propionate family kinase [Marinibactrum halimedae]